MSQHTSTFAMSHAKVANESPHISNNEPPQHKVMSQHISTFAVSHAQVADESPRIKPMSHHINK
jgi:hypothetical protein